jgi:type VI secretion system protein ImpA
MGIDIEGMLSEISPEAPCGDDLAYDPAYLELERSAQGTGEQQIGDTIVEATEPSWKDILSQSTELLSRTRDLRVIIYLTLGSMKTNGLPGLRDGLRLLSETLNRYWDTVHPQLDPDDDNDPMERMNILASLATRDAYQDPISFLKRLREIPVVQAPQLGSFSLGDVLVARGELPTEEGASSPPQEAHIMGAFSAGDPGEITANAEALEQSVSELGRINETLMDRAGASQAPDLGGLEEALGKIQQLYASAGVGEAPAAAPTEASDTQAAPAAAPAAGLAGEVQTRDDVIRALDKICRYCEKYEPSSPLPLLLRRARRLVTMDFVEIIRDLTPDGVSQIEVIGGISLDESSEDSDE